MKKLFTLFLLSSSLSFLAQGPVVEGTYLPVRGTSIKQAWSTVAGQLAIPTTGINQVWDYSTGQFPVSPAIYQIKTFKPDTTPYHQYFPGATHVTFLRTPFTNADNYSDSLYSYFKIDTAGVHSLGGFSIKAAFDTSLITTPNELMIPFVCSYGMTPINDTSISTGYVTYPPFGNVKLVEKKYKLMEIAGYGTLKTPMGQFNNTLLAKETVTVTRTLYTGTSYTTQIYTTTGGLISYAWIAKNTFGSSYLMHLSANIANTQSLYGWYVLPVDIGTISGTVFTDNTEATKVNTGNNEVLLYRENSNFAKNDILARSAIDANGKYKFDSIPYGEYRIAVRPDTSIYHRAFTTYYGDTTSWDLVTPIITTTSLTPNKNIHLRYEPVANGNGSLGGQLNQDLTIYKIAAINPVPGVGVVIKKNPGGGAVRGLVTNSTGGFDINNLEAGSYFLFVDIPGLQMADTCVLTIGTGGTVLTGLDFTIGTHLIHPNCQTPMGIKESSYVDGVLSAYPNPYSSSTNIELSLTENSAINLEVYNTLGEHIQTLYKGTKQAGTYNYNFSAKTLHYPAGMYIIKLAAGNKTSVLKVIEQ